MSETLNRYTVVCGGHPLVTLTIDAANAAEALLYADALLKDGIPARVEPLPPLFPGKAGTIPAAGLTAHAMGDGANKPCRIIKDGRVMQYVGIGWVDERAAVPADADALPTVQS